MNDDRTFKPEEIVSKLRAENLRLKNVIEIANHRIKELEAHGLCRCADEVRCDMRKLIADCDPYLKDGETPAECIQRNRDDAGAVLKLLAKEKRKYEALVDRGRELVEKMRRGNTVVEDDGTVSHVPWFGNKCADELRALLEDE